MEQLWYNTQTKVVFGADSSQSPDCRPITHDEIADLIANGATVDASANDVGNAESSDSTSSKPEESAVNSTGTSLPNDTIFPAGTATDSTESADSTAEIVPNAPVSGVDSASEPSTVVSAPVASGDSVVAESPEDLAAMHPETTVGISYSTPEKTGDDAGEAAALAESTAIVGAGNMHLNAHRTDATGTTGTVDGRPVLSNATHGYTATLKPGIADTGATSDHPAHGMLTALWKSLEGNSMANEARELILKIRATL